MHNKALVKHYTSYVNNFAVAMHILERSIIKKTKFVQFLKEKYKSSKTSLSLQGLLLKPIQRFPQYILFLTVSLLLWLVIIYKGCVSVELMYHESLKVPSLCHDTLNFDQWRSRGNILCMKRNCTHALGIHMKDLWTSPLVVHSHRSKSFLYCLLNFSHSRGHMYMNMLYSHYHKIFIVR